MRKGGTAPEDGCRPTRPSPPAPPVLRAKPARVLPDQAAGHGKQFRGFFRGHMGAWHTTQTGFTQYSAAICAVAGLPTPAHRINGPAGSASLSAGSAPD